MKSGTLISVQTFIFLHSLPQLAFWQNRSISLVDMYLDQGDPSEKCGELNFGLEYDFATQTLKLKINQVSKNNNFW